MNAVPHPAEHYTLHFKQYSEVNISYQKHKIRHDRKATSKENSKQTLKKDHTSPPRY
jgi:hypothetical protein